MPKIKLPKALLANEHLLIRKRAKRSIFFLAKRENKSIADLVEEMINKHFDNHYPEDTNSYQDYYIKQSNQQKGWYRMEIKLTNAQIQKNKRGEMKAKYANEREKLKQESAPYKRMMNKLRLEKGLKVVEKYQP